MENARLKREGDKEGVLLAVLLEMHRNGEIAQTPKGWCTTTILTRKDLKDWPFYALYKGFPKTTDVKP